MRLFLLPFGCQMIFSSFSASRERMCEREKTSEAFGKLHSRKEATSVLFGKLAREKFKKKMFTHYSIIDSPCRIVVKHKHEENVQPFKEITCLLQWQLSRVCVRRENFSMYKSCKTLACNLRCGKWRRASGETIDFIQLAVADIIWHRKLNAGIGAEIQLLFSL